MKIVTSHKVAGREGVESKNIVNCIATEERKARRGKGG